MTDENPNDYTYAEKLQLVAQELMDPKEIGITTAEEAQNLIVLKSPGPTPHLGDFCTFEVSEVPHALRAKWAKQDRKLVEVGDNFEADWIEANKDNHLLQARLRCGNVGHMLEQTVSDVVLGFAAMLAQAGGLLELMKKRFDEGNFAPPVKKDPLLEPEGSIEVDAEVVLQS